MKITHLFGVQVTYGLGTHALSPVREELCAIFWLAVASDVVQLRTEAHTEGVQIIHVHAGEILLAIDLLLLAGNDAHACSLLTDARVKVFDKRLYF